MGKGEACFYITADINDVARLKGRELELIPDVGTARQTQCGPRRDCSTGTIAQRSVLHRDADCEMYHARDVGEWWF